jgi:hypothetical protein
MIITNPSLAANIFYVDPTHFNFWFLGFAKLASDDFIQTHDSSFGVLENVF